VPRALERAALLIRRDATLGSLLDRLERVHGTRRLVEEAGGGLALTYTQAAKRVRRWAGGIARHVEPGEPVVVATPNGYEQLLLCLAVSRAGGIPAPVNALMQRDEVDHVIADTGARLVLRSALQVDSAEPLAEAHPSAPDDIAALFYTSGTTGRPKGVELTHTAIVGQLSRAAMWPAGLRRDEAVIALPVAHIMGFVTLVGLAYAGIPVFLLPRFNPVEVLDAIERRRSTVFVGVPAMYRMLLDADAEERDLRSVRVWASGADAMPAELANRFKKMGATVTLPLLGSVGEALFAEGYGLVEVGGGVAAKVSPPYFGVERFGRSVGFTLPGYRTKVVDDEGREVVGPEVGELLVQGPGVLKGYWGDAGEADDVLTDDGWLRTGDLVRRGPFRTLLFEGRKKHVIKRGGYSVYAVEVEQALERHPAVAEAAVVGLPDDRLGELPAAAIRLAPGEKVEADELLAWAADQLAEYKVPVRVVFVDELPRTGTTKVQKDALRTLFT
jgi:acyl-CoA synthetase (AMP-forming)/AMP-acid ligase II